MLVLKDHYQQLAIMIFAKQTSHQLRYKLVDTFNAVRHRVTSQRLVDTANLVLPTPGVPVTRMLGRVRDMAATHNTTLALGPNIHSLFSLLSSSQ